MTLLQTEIPKSSQQDSSKSMRHQLDVFKNEEWTHSLELPMGKCTIGSSPSCQVRLQENEVRPLHCLLVYCESGISATSWAPGVLLNDQEFSTASVFVGDVLSIGCVQLKLSLAANPASDYLTDSDCDISAVPSAESSSESISNRDDSKLVGVLKELDLPTSDLASCEIELRRELAKLTLDRKQNRQRCRQLIRELRHQRDRQRTFQTEVASIADRLAMVERERDSLAKELELYHANFAEESHSLSNQIEALQHERDGLVQEIERIRIHNSEENQRLVSAVNVLQEERGSLLAEIEQLHSAESQKIESLTSQLEHVRQEQQFLNAEFEQQLLELSDQKKSLVEQLETATTGHAVLSTELDNLRNSSEDREAAQAAEIARLNNELTNACEKLDQSEAARHDFEKRSQEHAGRVEEIQKECETLETANREFQAEKEQIAEALAKSKNHISDLEEALRISQESAQIAEDKLAERNGREQELQNAFDSMREEHSEVLCQNERLQHEASEKQAAIAELEGKLRFSEDLQQATAQQIGDLTVTLNSLREEQEQFRAEREKLVRANEDLTRQSEEIRKRSALLEIDVKSLKHEWQQSQAEVARLREDRLAVESRLEQLQAEYADFDKDAFSVLRVECESLSQQNESLQTEVAEQNEMLERKHEELEQLREGLIQKQSDLGALAAELHERSREHDLVNGEMNSLKIDLAEQSEERNRYEEQYLHSEKLVQELQFQLDSLNESLSQFQDEREKLIQNATTYENQCAELKTQLESKNADAARLETEHEQRSLELENHEKRFEQLTSQLDILQSKVSQAEIERERLAEKLAAKEFQLAELTRELEVFRAAQTHQEESNEEYAQCIATQVDQIEELTSHIESVQLKLSHTEQERDHLAQQLAAREVSVEQLTDELNQSKALLAECGEQTRQLNEAYQQSIAELDLARETNSATLTREELALLHSDALSETENTSGMKSIERTSESQVQEDALDSSPDCETEKDADVLDEFQPTSFIEKYSHLLDENDQEIAKTVSENAPTLENRSVVLERSSAFLSGESDDGDLEAYMSSLMRRVRGEMAGEPNSVYELKGSGAYVDRESQSPIELKKSGSDFGFETNNANGDEPNVLLDLAELKASCTKSAPPIDLTAMRELANTSARSAIAKHRKRRHFEGALGRSLVTVVAGATATTMIASAEHYAHPLFFGGCAVGVVSIYWGLKLAATLLEMIREGSDMIESLPAELLIEGDSLPIEGSVHVPSSETTS